MKINNIFIFLMLLAGLSVFMPAYQAKATNDCSRPDGETITANPSNIIVKQDSKVVVTFKCSISGYDNQFGIKAPVNKIFGSGRAVAARTTFDLGTIKANNELVFYITNPLGEKWLSGPASSNSDNVVHSDLKNLSDNQWQVGFEDVKGGFDKDYNDIIFTVTVAPIASGAPAPTACNSNADCGINGFTGNSFCQGSAVYKNFQTFTCNNPGTAQASCSSSVTAQLQNQCAQNQFCSAGTCNSVNVTTPLACNTNSDCGTNGFVGGNFCQGSGIYENFQTFTCNNSGTAQASCSSSVTAQLQNQCTQNQYCSDGACQNVNVSTPTACSSNADCGVNGFIGGPFCQGNGIYKNFQTFTCDNPGTASASCSSTVTAQLQNSCSSGQYCSDGQCSNINIATTTATCNSHSYAQCSSNSVYWFDSCGNKQDLHQLCTSSQTCQNSACVNQAQPPPPPTSTTNTTAGNFPIVKLVRNLSSGSLNWANSTNASPRDIVQFQITINLGGSGGSNVIVKDVLPDGLSFNGNLMINGSANSGNIISGLNLGNLSSGQNQTIIYDAKVAEPERFASSGATTLRNYASLTYSGNISNSSATVLVSKGTTNPTSVSTGLTNNFWLDSFFLPGAAGLGGLWFWRMGMFGFVEWIDRKKSSYKDHLVKKQLVKKITDIRKKEKTEY